MEMLLSRGQEGDDIARMRAALADALGETAGDYPGLAGGRSFDGDCEAAVRRWQSGVGLVADGIVGPRCQTLLGLRSGDAALPGLEAVRKMFPATKASNIARYLPYVDAALAAAGLVDRPLVCAAFGTVRAESEGFLPIAEFPSHYNTLPGQAAFSAYDGKLGNRAAGDGARYRGRGFVQLTGRKNYAAYGRKIGLDLEANPDLAQSPEVAAVLLAVFLADCAVPMRTALAAGNYKAARKLVNGGSHGLDRFQSVFALAEAAWPVAVTPAARAAAPAAATTATKRDATKDAADLRDRTYLPPPATLPDEFPAAADINGHLSAYTAAGLILDQGQEGACTGFGLACVINYLRWRKSGMPKRLPSVSPRMLYTFARRYDEYEGEDYDGSSCRGALKGWYHHGVCLADDWAYAPGHDTAPKFGWADRAVDTTLGVYYRIDTASIIDLQAAINEVGAIYVSSYTHKGWDAVPAGGKAPDGHASLPIIPFGGRPSRGGGHAYALVGFNTQGFVLQNSWGTGWGRGGFAVITYADWLAHAMDAWVAALGVRGVMVGRLTAGTGSAALAGAPGSWWSEDDAYRHSVVLGNDGRVDRYYKEDAVNRNLLQQACVLPQTWLRGNGAAKKRVVVYAHGGLNSEADGIQRARAMGRFFKDNGCYPIFLVWKTGILESIGNILADTFGRRAGAVSDVSDWLIEKSIGRFGARPIWSEMKQNADYAVHPGRGGDLLAAALQNLAAAIGPDFELHLIGHSAGSIILGHLLDALTRRGVGVQSAHLYAPACTVDFANRHYAPHAEVMKRLYLDVLSDANERDDNVVEIYRKSLLYLVSNALEIDLRTPILGLAKVFDSAKDGDWDGSSSTAETLGNWRAAALAAGLAKRWQTLDAPKIRTCADPETREAASHGSFDNNIDIVARTLQRITGAPLAVPVDDLRGF